MRLPSPVADAGRRSARSWERLKGAAPVLGLLGLSVVFLFRIALTNRVLTGLDVFAFFYPYREYATRALEALRFPLWNPLIFGGVPFFADSQSGVLYPLNLLLSWLPVPAQITWSIVLHIAMGSAFAYLFARDSMRLGRMGAFVTGAVWAMGGFLGAQAEHVNQLQVSAWLPLVLWLWGRADLSEPGSTRVRLWRALPWLVALAVVMAVGLFAGHAQSSFIVAGALVLVSVWPLLGGRLLSRDGARRRTSSGWAATVLALVLVAALAALLAAVQLLPTIELAGESVRAGGMAYRDAVSFSLKPRMLLTALFPAYRSGVFSEYIAYTGILAMVLAVVGVFHAPRRRLVAMCVLLIGVGLLLALGAYNPLYYVLYRVVPGFSMFRAPARWLLLYHLGVAMLAGMGMDAIRSGRLSRIRRWWRGPLLAAGVAVLILGIGSVWMERPSLSVAAVWAGTALGGAALVWLAASRRWKPAAGILAIGLVAELVVAGQSLAVNQPTAPQAYSDTVAPVAYLQSQLGEGRVLSLSDLTFDPGNLADVRSMYGAQLSENELYRLQVATKQKEALIPNLSMRYGMPSLDGYGGGVLPLSRYARIEGLLLPDGERATDGRLYQALEGIPDGRMLSVLGVEYIICDKVGDVWLDGVYYDLSHEAVLASGQSVDVEIGDASGFRATAIGVVSHLEGMADAPDGIECGALVVDYAGGEEQRIPLVIGSDTSEGAWTSSVAHARARVAREWVGDTQGADYYCVTPLILPGAVRSLRVECTADVGALVVDGISLVDERTDTYWPLIASDSGRFELVYTGDVKVYRLKDSVSRVRLASTAIPSDSPVEAVMDGGFDPSTDTVVPPGAAMLEGVASPEDRADVLVDEPERIVVRTVAASRRVLVVSDAYYPGWEATVDGEAAQIWEANGFCRAVVLEPGEHTVEMVYRPQSVRVGALLSAVGAALVAILVGWRRCRRSRRA